MKSIKLSDFLKDGIAIRLVFLLFFSFGLIVKHRFNLTPEIEIEKNTSYFCINPISQLRYSDREL